MKEKPLTFPPRSASRARVNPPARPEWLKAGAAEAWDRLAVVMAHNGWLDDATVLGFAEICTLGEEVRHLEQLVSEVGLEKAIEGKVFDTLLATQRLLLEYSSTYFMTPASRAEHGVTFRPLPGA